MSVDDVVGRCRVVPQGYPTGEHRWRQCWQHVGSVLAVVAVCWQGISGAGGVLAVFGDVWALQGDGGGRPAASAAAALVSLFPPSATRRNKRSPHCAPPGACGAAIDTFECAGTFTRKTKKFGPAPELAIPEDLQDFVPGGQEAAAARAHKGGRGAATTRLCWCMRAARGVCAVRCFSVRWLGQEAGGRLQCAAVGRLPRGH